MPCVQRLGTLMGGSQHPHAAPRTTNQTDPHIRTPNPCIPTTGYTAPTPGPQCDKHLPQEHTTVNRAPGCATFAPATQRAHHAHIPSNALPNSVTTRPSKSAIPITTTKHTHSPHPETPTKANLTPPGQAAHLQSMRPSYSVAQGGARSNRGWQGHRQAKTATPRTVPKDTEAQAAPAACLTHRP